MDDRRRGDFQLRLHRLEAALAYLSFECSDRGCQSASGSPLLPADVRRLGRDRIDTVTQVDEAVVAFRVRHLVFAVGRLDGRCETGPCRHATDRRDSASIPCLRHSPPCLVSSKRPGDSATRVVRRFRLRGTDPQVDPARHGRCMYRLFRLAKPSGQIAEEFAPRRTIIGRLFGCRDSGSE